MSDSESTDPADLDDDFSDNKQSYIHKPLCYILPIWHPYCKFKIIWNFFVIVILLFTSIQIPFALAFDMQLTIESGLGIVVFIMDLFLCIDICVTFRTAFYDQYDPLLLIATPETIVQEYLKFWFWFDLITSFPFDFIIGPLSVGYAHYIKILRLIRIIRIFRIFKVLRIVSFSHAGTNYSPALIYKFTICKIIFAMAFISHLFACLWWAVGTWMMDKSGYDETWVTKAGLDDDSISIGTKYSTSMYWAVITLFTTGYGDITATNVIEQWVAIFCVGAGSCVSAWFIGAFSALVVEGTSIQHTQREAVDRAQSFCAQFQFDDELQRAIISHTKYYYHYNYFTERNEDVMNCLPLHVQNDIRQRLATRSLKQIDLFKDLPNEVVGNIVLKIKSVACNRGYRLFQKGEVASELYICRKGKGVLIADIDSFEQDIDALDNGKEVLRPHDMRVIKPGHVVGEYCLSENKRSKTLKCIEWSEFMVVGKDDIVGCIQDYFDEKEADEILNGLINKLNSKNKKRKVRFNTDEKSGFERDSSIGNPKHIVHNDSISNIKVSFGTDSMSDDKVVDIERRKLKRMDRKRDVYEDEKNVNVELSFINGDHDVKENSDQEWSLSRSKNDQRKHEDVDKKVKGKKNSFFKMNFFNKKGKKNDVDKKYLILKKKPPDKKGKYQKTGHQSEYDESDSNNVNSDAGSEMDNGNGGLLKVKEKAKKSDPPDKKT